MKKMKNKGALELSIGTIVVMVIAMSMLVLGLVLVRTILTGAKGSVDTLNEQVLNEIVDLFGDESGNLLIKLGSANTAKVKPGNRFNVAIGAQHPGGEAIERDSLQFKVDLDTESNNNCVRKIGQSNTERLFVTRVNSWNEFGRFSGSTAAALIEINVPKGTPICTQKVNVDVKIKEATQSYEGGFFILEVGKEGIF